MQLSVFLRGLRWSVGSFLFFLFAGSGNFAEAAASARVVSFSPEGLHKDPKQVRVKFSEPLLAFGDLGVEKIPFAIDCAAKGEARWLDPLTWSFQFLETVPSGVKCNFRLKADLQSLAKKPVVSAKTFSLNTGGPQVERSFPSGGAEIFDDQNYLLILDGPVDGKSISGNVWLAVEGLGERLPLHLVELSALEQKISREESLKNAAKVGRLVALATDRKLPPEKRVTLVWGKNIASPSGLRSKKATEVTFTVRAPLRLNWNCDRERSAAACIPLRGISLHFTAPLAWEQLQKVRLRADSGGDEQKPLPPYEYERETRPTTSTLRFAPVNQANSTWSIVLPEGLKDEEGRPLQPIPPAALKIKFGAFPPLAKFAGLFGILETEVAGKNQIQGVLPVTLRAVAGDLKGEALSFSSQRLFDSPGEVLNWYRLVEESKRTKSVFDKKAPPRKVFSLPKINEENYATTQVVGIPLLGTGFHVVELESQILGSFLLEKPAPVRVQTAALVTDLAVHTKWNDMRGGVAWVTRLSTGKPVAGAQVRLVHCTGKIVFEGTTASDGVVVLPGQKWGACDGKNTPLSATFAVVAKFENDASFTLSNWTEGLENWRFHVYDSGSTHDLLRAHTVLDRSLFRAGETVHMKHFFRVATLDRVTLPAANAFPKSLVVVHGGTRKEQTFPLTWDVASGIALSEFPLPRSQKLGDYSIYLEGAAGEPSRRVFTAEFSVEEVKIPLVRMDAAFPETPPVHPNEISLSLSGKHLSGGMASGVDVKVATAFQKKYVRFEDFDAYTFAASKLAEGKVADTRYEFSDSSAESPEIKKYPIVAAKLDAQGAAVVPLRNLPASDVPLSVASEVQFRDPNGESQSRWAQTTLWPSGVVVGVSSPKWAESDPQEIELKLVVLDVRGKPQAGKKVAVTAFSKKLTYARKRLVGGFYGYESSSEIQKIGSFCNAVTGPDGTVSCKRRAPAQGAVVFEAVVFDAQNNPSYSQSEIFVRAEKPIVLAANNDDRADLLPEKKEYAPGETARLQLRLPFAEAQILLTIETDGIVRHEVRSWKASSPAVPLAIPESYVPNVYVSVLAVRGRLGEPPATALIDLGKPAFRAALTNLKVSPKNRLLKVTVSPDKDVYEVRNKAQVKIQVVDANGKPPGVGEVAFFAVDEGLLELKKNDTWDLFQAMLGERSNKVSTATSQMQVVGRRHFGLKAIPTGGGGGQSPGRQLFDTLLLWKGRVPLDDEGRASVEVPLNDALTSFRLVAVASAVGNKFGTGSAVVRTTQDVQLVSALPQVVREGDFFQAEMSVRNTTKKPLELEIHATAKGFEPATILPVKILKIPAAQSAVVSWDINVGKGFVFDDPVVGANASVTVWAVQSGRERDRMTAPVRILPRGRTRVLQAQISQFGEKAPVVVPLQTADMGESVLQVGLSKSLAASVKESGAREMRRYPYTCTEQKASRAVALHDKGLWDALMGELPQYLDDDGLLRFFPGKGKGNSELTAYIAVLADAVAWPLPAELKKSMGEGLSRFVAGKGFQGKGSVAEFAQNDLRRVLALDGLRALGLFSAKQLATIKVDIQRWPTGGLLAYWSLVRSSTEVEKELRGRIVEAGGRARLEDRGDSNLGSYLLAPQASVGRFMWMAARQAVTAKAFAADLAKLVRSESQPQSPTQTKSSVEYAWLALGLSAFEKSYENVDVAGNSTAVVGDMRRKYEWNKKEEHTELTFPLEKAASLKITQEGKGSPWANLQIASTIPVTTPVNAGYSVSKKIDPLDGAATGSWKIGDTYRVTLTVNAQMPQPWVVFDDPIPAGATILPDDDPPGMASSAPYEFVETSRTARRVYYSWLPRGEVRSSYRVRLNHAGRFSLPATRVEAMYAPAIFGEFPNIPVAVTSK